MSSQAERIKVLCAGILSIILTLGIARFSYTPLLPLMQKQAGLGVAEGGWLAAINYLGYLCGALLASLIGDLQLKDRLYRIGLIVAVVSTAGMGLTENLWLWLFLRFWAGLSSAAGMLLGSGLVLNWLIRNDHRTELGIHFSGIGLGIAYCALAVEVMQSYLNWSEQWLAFTLMGALLLIPAWRWLPRPEVGTQTRNGETMHDNPPSPAFMRGLMAAYFCAGVGYVVSATFLVAIVEQLPGLAGSGAIAFMLLGLAAAPACIIWDFIARRIGNLNSLVIACVLQVLGILLPVALPGLLPTMLGALLFGGTFIGIVSLVLVMAGRYYPTRPAKMMGKMTISYGVAQILAPAVTGLLAGHSGNYDAGLYLASGVMLVGAVLMLYLRQLERRELAIADAFSAIVASRADL